MALPSRLCGRLSLAFFIHDLREKAQHSMLFVGLNTVHLASYRPGQWHGEPFRLSYDVRDHKLPGDGQKLHCRESGSADSALGTTELLCAFVLLLCSFDIPTPSYLVFWGPCLLGSAHCGTKTN